MLELLAAHDVSLWIADHHLAPAPWSATAGHVYVRAMVLRGVSGTTIRKTPLRDWARHIRRWRREEGLYLFIISTTTRRAPRPKTRGG